MKAYISYKNNQIAKVLFDDHTIRDQMVEYFSFRPENVEHNPMYKRTAWDGYIRPFKKNGDLPLGLVKEAYQWLTRYPIEVEIDDAFVEFFNCKETPQDIEKDILEYQDTLNSKYKLREYQFKGAVKALLMQRALIESPTGSGKTFLAFHLMMYLVRKYNYKILMVVPQISLVLQAIREFTQKYGSNETFFHGIYEDQSKDTDKPIVISTRDGLNNHTKTNQEWFQQFDVLIVDEAHEAEAKTLTNIYKQCTNAKYRFGMSGSFFKPKTEMRVLTGMFGPKFITRTTKELIDDGTLASLMIHAILLEYSDKDKTFVKKSKLKYQGEAEYINTHELRNKYVVDLCSKLEGNTLCLFRNIDHGDYFYEIAQSLQNAGKKFYILSGKDKAKVRQEVQLLMEENSDIVLFASYGTFSTGVDINNLHNVVLGSPMKSSAKVVQSIGRGLRKAENKESVKIWDIIDDLSVSHTKSGRKLVEPFVNYALRHGQHRIGLYEYQEYDYEIQNVSLEN